MGSNTLLTPSAITRYSIKLFTNTNWFIRSINRDYDDRFAVEGARIGAQLRVRLPNDYTVTDGPGISVQDTSEQQVVLTVSTQRHVDVAFTSAERTLSLDDYGERVLMPRVNVLCGNVAFQIMQNMTGGARNAAANVDANNNILPITDAVVATSRALLEDNSAPGFGDTRKMVVDPHSDTRLQQAMRGLLNPATKISGYFTSGMVRNGLGFDIAEDQTVIKHTTGTLTTGTVNGASQTGNSITVNALGGTLLQGDIISIAGVNGVNRVTKASLGVAAQFVVTANAAAGAVSISIYPAIIPPASSVAYAGLPYTPQQYQTVTASPANSAVITPFANAGVTYRQNYAFAREAITMVTADLWMPPAGKGVIEAARHMMDSVSMRSLVCYEPATDQPIDRLDVLFGSLVPRPEWVVASMDSVP